MLAAGLLQSDQDLLQMLPQIAEELNFKPVPAEALPRATEPAEVLRPLKRRKGCAIWPPSRTFQ